MMLVLLTGLLIYLNMEKDRTMESARVVEEEVVMIPPSFEKGVRVENSEGLQFFDIRFDSERAQ